MDLERNGRKTDRLPLLSPYPIAKHEHRDLRLDYTAERHFTATRWLLRLTRLLKEDARVNKNNNNNRASQVHTAADKQEARMQMERKGKMIGRLCGVVTVVSFGTAQLSS